MVRVNVHEAKSTLSQLLSRVEAGERVVIARAGRPVAELVPLQSRSLVFGAAAGEIEIGPAAFDWPDEELSRQFYGTE